MSCESSQKLRHNSQSPASSVRPAIQSSRNLWQSCITSLSWLDFTSEKLLAQFADDAKQSFLHCTHAGAEIVRDFLTCQTGLVFHHKHQTLLRRQPFEPFQDLLNQDIVEGCPIGTCNCKAGPLGHVCRPRQNFFALLTNERIHHDPMKPRVE